MLISGGVGEVHCACAQDYNYEMATWPVQTIHNHAILMFMSEVKLMCSVTIIVLLHQSDPHRTAQQRIMQVLCVLYQGCKTQATLSIWIPPAYYCAIS